MDKAARARQRILAIFLPITALLYVSAEALNPKGADVLVSDTATAVKVLPIAAAHSAQLYLSGSLTLLALGGLAVSYPAIATLVRGRGWVVATVAALLGAVGAFCGIVVNGLFEVNRDGVSVRLPYVFCCWLRCVICAGGRGCRRCGPVCAGLPGCGTRMPGGLRVWRAGSGSRRRRS
jgi:hypothetical protein